MVKHRGFPGRMPGTDFQFTIRRAAKEGASRILRRERYADRRAVDRAADRAFMTALWEHFGEEPFVRGNLDAGRLSWLIGREVVAVDDPFDPQDYNALMRVDRAVAEASFPEIFAENTAMGWRDEDDWDGVDDADDTAGDGDAGRGGSNRGGRASA
ncbi:hypothetical protein [Allgaiera indica]|nr:hypothetical protein [Allgaiera indica]